MSNKAIVFYTENKLTEEQELDVREKHGIENIIFVPVEDIKTITESNVLTTTPQPYTIYNYVNDANIAIAICDKIMAYEKSNRISIPYFIGIEAPVQAETPENVVKNEGRLFVISNAELLEGVDLGINEVDPKYDVFKIHVNHHTIELAERILDDKMFRGYSKPTFVFIDKRHPLADHLAVMINNFNVYNNITSITVNLSQHKLAPALQSCLDAMERQKAHDASRGVFNVNVDGMPMSASMEAIIDKVGNIKDSAVQHQFLGRLKNLPNERPDSFLSYGEAIEMCKTGIDVACVNWPADTFLTVNTGMVVHADNLWSPGNKRAAMSHPDKSMSVFPHFLRTDSFGTLPHMVDFNDQFSEWVVASDRVKVKNVKIDKTDGLDKLVLEFSLDTLSTPDFELAPFWIVYDVLAKLPRRVTVIGDHRNSLLPHIVGSMKEAHQQRSNLVEESFNIDEDGIEGTLYDFRGVDFLCSIGLSHTVDRIRTGELTDVILDYDSFKTDFRLDKLKEALQEANVNWVTVSVKEQLFGISE